MVSENEKKVHCGLVMPISAADDCTAEHWAEVKTIVTEVCDSISTPRFEAKLVSEDDAVGVIHKRIVQNIYSSDIVICDISGRNPNVMFELGMRLAFDKATVIIKDDRTPYSFDTGVIEHLEYPRSLRFGSIIKFKQKLSEKLSSTYAASKAPGYSTFLKNFGEFKTIALEQKADSPEGVMLDMLTQMQLDISRLRANRAEITPHEFSPVHSRAIPEMMLEIQNAEKVHGPKFWKSNGGLQKLLNHFEENTECDRYWLSNAVFRKVLLDELEEKEDTPIRRGRAVRPIRPNIPPSPR